MRPQDRTRAILRSGLDPETKLIVIAIADHMDEDGDGSYVSIETGLPALTGLSLRTIRRRVSDAVDAHWLGRCGKNGAQRRDWRIFWERIPAPAPTPVSVTGVPPDPGQRGTPTPVSVTEDPGQRDRRSDHDPTMDPITPPHPPVPGGGSNGGSRPRTPGGGMTATGPSRQVRHHAAPMNLEKALHHHDDTDDRSQLDALVLELRTLVDVVAMPSRRSWKHLRAAVDRHGVEEVRRAARLVAAGGGDAYSAEALARIRSGWTWLREDNLARLLAALRLASAPPGPRIWRGPGPMPAELARDLWASYHLAVEDGDVDVVVGVICTAEEWAAAVAWAASQRQDDNLAKAVGG